MLVTFLPLHFTLTKMLLFWKDKKIIYLQRKHSFSLYLCSHKHHLYVHMHEHVFNTSMSLS